MPRFSVENMHFFNSFVIGYQFGSTIVPYNEEDQNEYGWLRENRCLKLMQFAKRSQVYVNQNEISFILFQRRSQQFRHWTNLCCEKN